MSDVIGQDIVKCPYGEDGKSGLIETLRFLEHSLPDLFPCLGAEFHALKDILVGVGSQFLLGPSLLPLFGLLIEPIEGRPDRVEVNRRGPASPLQTDGSQYFTDTQYVASFSSLRSYLRISPFRNKCLILSGCNLPPRLFPSGMFLG